MMKLTNPTGGRPTTSVLSRIRNLVSLIRQNDVGASEGISLLIVMPALIGLVFLLVAATRIALAGNSTEIAASSAAHAAVQERSTSQGSAMARTVANSTMALSEFRCSSVNVTVDATRATRTLGVTGYMTVTVKCTVSLSDLSLLPLPGNMTLTRTSTSPTSAYMERTS
jgi:Flp pilus assembly protein TadG